MTNTKNRSDNKRNFLFPCDLEPLLNDFKKELIDRGFTELTIYGYESSISHFGMWLKSLKINLKEVNQSHVDRFAIHRCGCPGGRKDKSVSKKYVKRIERFIVYLDTQGLLSYKREKPNVDRPQLILDFETHLDFRGLSSTTIVHYSYSILIFLPMIGFDPNLYSATSIKRATCDFAKTHKQSETKNLTTALRAYLRFLSVENLCVHDLDQAVPTVAQWSLSSIPRYITAPQVEAIINSCDSNTPKGLRDRAIILLLSRLGLRVGDIVNLELEDLDWSEGTIRICGKGKREDLLPLPQDAGDAVIAYLNGPRHLVDEDKVFLCLNAPLRPFAASSCVSSIVDSAITRAGISNPPSRGAHLLRHSAATEFLRAGASLETVSSILRHRSLEMTAYYAKVDIAMLAKIAQPWPEVASC